jgi:hypothetical protein
VQCSKKTQKGHPEPQKGNADPGSQPLHDNVRYHTERDSQELLTSFGWDIVSHPSYSPDLAPSDYHFFTKLKEFLGGKRFSNDQEVEGVAETAGGGGL